MDILYDMTYDHTSFFEKEPGLPGVPFTFSLSESPWSGSPNKVVSSFVTDAVFGRNLGPRHPGPRREAGSIQLLGLRFSPGSDVFFGKVIKATPTTQKKTFQNFES